VGFLLTSTGVLFSDVTSAPSLLTFRKRLKLHLFRQSYPGLVLKINCFICVVLVVAACYLGHLKKILDCLIFSIQAKNLVKKLNWNSKNWCGSLAQCALSLKRLSAGPGFNPQTRLNKLFHDYWRACFEINFSDAEFHQVHELSRWQTFLPYFAMVKNPVLWLTFDLRA